MRIISKFKDYYDGVQRLGYDETLVYIRKFEEIPLYDNQRITDIHEFNHRVYTGDFRNQIDEEFIIIGFCGKLYSMVDIKNIICYIINDLDNAIEVINNKSVSKSYFSSRKRFPWESIEKRSDYELFFNDVLIVNDENESVEMKKKLEQIFIDYKTPIFVFGYSTEYKTQTLKINPCLKNFQFQRIVDPYTSYQEIGQYLSGILGQNDKPIVQISDVDMRDKKGFDEWSFKKKGIKKKGIK